MKARRAKNQKTKLAEVMKILNEPIFLLNIFCYLYEIIRATVATQKPNREVSIEFIVIILFYFVSLEINRFVPAKKKRK